MNYTREELIQICVDAVVHHTKWQNRDSYCAQREIQSIHHALSAGMEYVIDPETDEDTIWISFPKEADWDALSKTPMIEISSREDYFRDCDPEYESEMFDGNGIDFSSTYTSGYMPTRKRINERGKGEDWY